MRFKARFLEALAKETHCQTDCDLYDPNNGRLAIGFIGKARKGWVYYVDSATVRVHFPRWNKQETLHLEDPKSFDRLDKIFNDTNWIYFPLEHQ